MNYSDCPLVPASRIEHPWNVTINRLDTQIFAIHQPTSGQEHLAGMATAVWGVSLHWLYRKKWNSKHKIPGHRKLTSAVEPFGELLRAMLELAIQCHAVGSPNSKRYKHACDWFRLAAPELRLICLGEAQSKTELVAELRQILGELKDFQKDFQNPFFSTVYPNLSGLVQDARTEAERSDRFHNEYWRGLKTLKVNDGRTRGFIYSFSKLVNELQTNPVWKNVSLSPRDEIIAQMGRGREVMKLKNT